MITFFVTSTVMVLTVLAVRFLFRNKVGFLILYPLWGIVLLRFLIPFTSIESPVSIMNLAGMAAGTVNDFVSEQEEKTTVKDLKEINVPPVIQAPQQFHSEQKEDKVVKEKYSGKERKKKRNAAGLIWLCVSILLLVCIAGSNALFYRRLYKDRKKVLQDLGCKGFFGRKLPVYVASSVQTPCLAGIFHPAIYLPPGIYEGKEHLRQILAHEQIHDRHGDPVWALLRMLCCIVYWFDPFVWLAAFYSKQDAEIACDEAVLKNCTDEERYCYGLMLIQMSKKGWQENFYFITSMENGKRNLKERITMLTKKRKKDWRQIIGMVTVMVLLAGCGLTGSAQSGQDKVTDNGGKIEKRETGLDDLQPESPENSVVDNEMILQAFQHFMEEEIKERTEWENLEEWDGKTKELYFSIQYLTASQIPCLLVAAPSVSPSPIIMKDKARLAMVYYYDQQESRVELLTVLRTIGSGYPLKIKDGQFVVNSDQHAVRVYDWQTEGEDSKLMAKEVYGYGTYDQKKKGTVYTYSELTWQAPLPVEEGTSPYTEDLDTYAEKIYREYDYKESKAEEFDTEYGYGYESGEIIFSKNTKKVWADYL